MLWDSEKAVENQFERCKKAWLLRGFVGDEKLPSFFGVHNKDPYTRDADNKVFDDGFKSALQALKMDTIAVKPFLKTLDKATFNEVAKLVLNGKEQNDVKIRKMAELTNEGKALLKTIRKTKFALENLRETMEKSIVEQFSGTDGRYMTRLKSLIESIKEGEGADKMD